MIYVILTVTAAGYDLGLNDLPRGALGKEKAAAGCIMMPIDCSMIEQHCIRTCIIQGLQGIYGSLAAMTV
jgi:hypothetical protein